MIVNKTNMLSFGPNYKCKYNKINSGKYLQFAEMSMILSLSDIFARMQRKSPSPVFSKTGDSLADFFLFTSL